MARPRKLPGPWTTTQSKQYLSAVHPMTCSLLWVRCLFDWFSIPDFGGKWPLKWKVSKMTFQIPWWDTKLRFVTKFGENRPLWSCWKVFWITTQKKLGLSGLVPTILPKMGLSHPKIPWTLSHLDMSTYTEFDLDWLRFAGLIPERLIFRPQK